MRPLVLALCLCALAFAITVASGGKDDAGDFFSATVEAILDSVAGHVAAILLHSAAVYDRIDLQMLIEASFSLLTTRSLIWHGLVPVLIFSANMAVVTARERPSTTRPLWRPSALRFIRGLLLFPCGFVFALVLALMVGLVPGEQHAVAFSCVALFLLPRKETVGTASLTLLAVIINALAELRGPPATMLVDLTVAIIVPVAWYRAVFCPYSSIIYSLAEARRERDLNEDEAHRLEEEFQRAKVRAEEARARCERLQREALLTGFDYGIEGLKAVLREGKADINARLGDGFTALMTAASKGLEDLVAFLIAEGADVRATYSGEDNNASLNGLQALHLAAARGHSSICRHLVKAGASVEAKTIGGITPLHFAALQDRSETIIVLVTELGAEVEATEKRDNTALLLSALLGNTKACKALLSLNASMLAKHEGGCLPIALAIRRGHAGIVDLLIKAGSPVNGVGPDGDCWVTLATSDDISMQNTLAVCEVLIGNGLGYQLLHSYAGGRPLDVARRSRHMTAYLAVLNAMMQVRGDDSEADAEASKERREAFLCEAFAASDLLAASDKPLLHSRRFIRWALTFASRRGIVSTAAPMNLATEEEEEAARAKRLQPLRDDAFHRRAQLVRDWHASCGGADRRKAKRLVEGKGEEEDEEEPFRDQEGGRRGFRRPKEMDERTESDDDERDEEQAGKEEEKE